MPPHPSPALPAPAATDPRPKPADSLRIPRSSASPDQQPFKEPSLVAGTRCLAGPRGTRFGRHRFASGHPATEQGPGSRHRGSCRPGRGSGRSATRPLLPKAEQPPHSRPEHDGETPAGSSQLSSSNSELAQADRWFTDKKYAEAGQALRTPCRSESASGPAQAGLGILSLGCRGRADQCPSPHGPGVG